MSNNDISNVDSEEPSLNMREMELEEENNHLKNELREASHKIETLKSNIVDLQRNKSILITAIRIIKEDYQQNTSHQHESDHLVNVPNITNEQNQMRRQVTNDCHDHGDKDNIRHTENNYNYMDTQKQNKGKHSTVIIGDSIVKGMIAERISKATSHKVIVRSFGGATTHDMKDYLKSTLRKNPENITLHVGTNNLRNQSPQEIVNDIKGICETIQSQCLTTNITVSELITREDTSISKKKVQEVNKELTRYFNLNSSIGRLLKHNIDMRGLNISGLHLNKTGYAILAKNITSHIKCI